MPTQLGALGVWDAALGYVRVDGISASGGVGPHEISTLGPGAIRWSCDNGGNDTHPDSGRAQVEHPH